MPGNQLASPFGTEALDRIRLARAPLVRVIAQLRFPNLAVMRDETVINAFASQLGKEYPVIQQQNGMNVLITPTGLTQQPSGQRILSLRSGDERWKITLAEGFLALDTPKYPNRKEFIDRFERAIAKLIELADPPYFERFGLRYVNRIDDSDLIGERLKEMIRVEMQGALAIEHPASVQIRHGLFDSLFSDGDYAIQMRSGVLPPQTVLDPEISPIDRPSWVLDIDSYTERRISVSQMELSGEMRHLADRAYRMFRWVVNDDFIQYFGGGHD